MIFDKQEFQSMLSSLKIEKTISGGSIANFIVGLSQLKNKAGFIGKVSDDELGSKYEDGLKSEKVEYFYSKKKRRFANWDMLNFNNARLRKDNVYIFRYCRKN